MPVKKKVATVLDAVQMVHDALVDFDADQQQRILQSALALLGIGQPATQARPGSLGVAAEVATPTLVTGRPVSLREVLEKAAPATQAQKVAVFAYYREKYEGMSRFSRRDLKGYFARAKEPPPSTYDREFMTAVKLGWIHEEGVESYLTSKGLEAVEAGFGGKARPRGRAVAKRKRSKAAADRRKRKG